MSSAACARRSSTPSSPTSGGRGRSTAGSTSPARSTGRLAGRGRSTAPRGRTPLQDRASCAPASSPSALPSPNPALAGRSGRASREPATRPPPRTAAREWGRQGITANAIAPGAWTKRGQDYAARDPEGFAKAMAARPIARLGDPETDIAPVALFLASEDARFLGQVLYVDGGAHL